VPLSRLTGEHERRIAAVMREVRSKSEPAVPFRGYGAPVDCTRVTVYGRVWWVTSAVGTVNARTGCCPTGNQGPARPRPSSRRGQEGVGDGAHLRGAGGYVLHRAGDRHGLAHGQGRITVRRVPAGHDLVATHPDKVLAHQPAARSPQPAARSPRGTRGDPRSLSIRPDKSIDITSGAFHSTTT
jgi:hypothetical protein